MSDGKRILTLLSNEEGSGSVLAVALVGVTVIIAASVLPLYTALALRQSVSGAADAAALAAADTASGRHQGYPCDTAAAIAGANGATVTSCQVDGLIVTVSASQTILGIPLTAAATAGPKP